MQGGFVRSVAALALCALAALWQPAGAGEGDRLVYDEAIIYASAEFSPALARFPALDRRMRRAARDLIEELRALAQTEANAAGTAGYAFQPYEIIITDEVRLDTPRFVSVLRQGYAYTGGTHGNEWTEPVVWDVARGTVVGIERFLGEGRRTRDGLAALSDYLRAGIAQQVWDNEIDPTWTGDIEAVTAPDPAILSNFVLVRSTEPGLIGGLAFQYDRYSVAPYVLGGAEIIVPQEVLRPYLRPDLLPLFGGAPG